VDSVIIRDVEDRDIPAIKKIISKVWDWTDMIEDEKILDATMGMYLGQVLYSATFGRVATLSGRVVGVIFGSLEGIEPKYRMLMEDGSAHMLTLLGASEEERRCIYECFSKLENVYEQLGSGRLDEYDGTLDFLVLDEKAQGLGVGKSLWMALKTYFEENNVKSIYVFSDTECNFGFYDHLGFERKKEQAVSFNFNERVFESDIFLYEYWVK